MKGYDPYSEGRWYRFRLTSNGNDTVRLVESDIEGAYVDGSSGFLMPVGYTPLKVVFDFPSVNKDITVTDYRGRFEYYHGSIGFTLPNVRTYRNGYIYVFTKKSK